MKHVVCVVFSVCIAGIAAPQEDKYINSLIDLLEEQNEQVRTHVHDELLDMGGKILPLLEKRIQEKGVSGCYKLIRDIEAKRKPTKIIVETELPDPESFKKQLKPVDKNQISNFYLTKYIEAYELVRKGALEAANEILDSLVKLERFPPYQGEISQLKAYCDQRLIQTTVIAARISPAKTSILPGEKIEVEFVIENKSKDKLSIEFASGNQILMQIQAHAFVLAGVENTIMKHETIEIDKNISIEKDKSWSKQFSLDLGQYQFSIEQANCVKYFYMWAYFSPTSISSVNGPRVVPFSPTVVKLIPKGMETLLQDPVKSLKEAIEKEKLNDIFFLALAVENDKRNSLFDSMIDWLSKTTSTKVSAAIAKSLERVTGRKFNTIKEWQDWWKSVKK